MSNQADFAIGDHVVYPTHGVGEVIALEEQDISGFKVELIVVNFARDKMTLRIPKMKANPSGLRLISSEKKMDDALGALKKKVKVKKAMWSRRAQEYEAKINSGDPVLIAEVVRELHISNSKADQSYSERQMYRAALDRLAREFAAVEEIKTEVAMQRIEELIRKAA